VPSAQCPAQSVWSVTVERKKETQLLQLKPYKTMVIHALQLRNPASRVHFCCWFLKCVTEDEIDRQLTFFSDEAWFGLQGYINMKNNRSWNSQNPRSLAPSRETWSLARRIARSVFFNGTVTCERYALVILEQFFPELTEEEGFYGWFQQDSATAHIACMSMQPSGTEISALLFGRHIHLTSILMIFPSVVLCRTKFKTVNPIWKN
jgi:hypothetical protein